MKKGTCETLSRQRRVTLTLNADLVDGVRGRGEDLSAVVEKLLADHLGQQRFQRLSRNRIAETTSAAWNAINSEHGSIADEFSTL